MTLDHVVTSAAKIETIEPSATTRALQESGWMPEPDTPLPEPDAPRDLPPDDDDTEALTPPEIGATYPTNDTGNGHRFKLYEGEDAISVPRVGWHIFDGKRYRLDPDMLDTRARAQRVQDHITGEIPHVMLEEWQVQELNREPKYRLDFDRLDGVDPDDRTPDQKAELDTLLSKLDFVKKLKAQRSSLKGAHRTFAKSSGNSSKIDAMLKEAAVHLSKSVDDLDSDPLTLNTETGILRFSVTDARDDGGSKTADYALERHAREVAVSGQDRPQYITKMMPVAYDPDARCPLFDAFLARVQPNIEIRAFLQRWFGLSLSGLPFQGFAFLYGDGANGKSVLVNLMARMAGDYAAKAKIESITGHSRRGGGDATPDLMGLIGARLAHAAEPEEGKQLQEAIIKELTGGEKILVRHLHSDFVEMTPDFKLVISGNHKPEIRGGDGGIWRRVKLVPFDVIIPPEERDEHLGDKLWKERSGILNWLIDGLLDFLEGGLREPDEVLAAVEEYRAESDPIGAFLRECCVFDPAERYLPARDLINGFNYWQDLKGEPMWERKASIAFAKRAGKHKDPATGRTYEKVKRAVTGYSGLRFTDEFQALVAKAGMDSKGRWIASKSSSDSDGGA